MKCQEKTLIQPNLSLENQKSAYLTQNSHHSDRCHNYKRRNYKRRNYKRHSH